MNASLHKQPPLDGQPSKRSRLEAVFGFENRIAGVAVVPFTIKLRTMLEVIGNPFITASREIETADADQFFDFIECPTRKEERPAVDYAVAIPGIYRYLREAEAGAPSEVLCKQVHESPEFIIHRFAARYGWSWGEVITMPYKQIWRLLDAQFFEDHKKGGL